MSVAIVACRAQIGLDAPLVRVEVSLGPGLPVFNIVGLAATVVKESKDRVRAALLNTDFEFPAGRIVVNLSPADLPKRGGRFDLPIALGILLASGEIRLPGPQRSSAAGTVEIGGEYYGELGLSGELKPVAGMLLAAAHAARDGHEIIVPRDNAEEVQLLLRSGARGGLVVRAAGHLKDVCDHLSGKALLPGVVASVAKIAAASGFEAFDLSDVRGQLQAKRALLVAAAGGHSLLMIGPPGAGKSMLAMRLPSLLPPLTQAESMEVAAIQSVSGTGFSAESFGRRPVRTPHHTASAVSLIGGGPRARPGEISLAHHGVLFLDELLEYDRRALEALREPMESGAICISRASLQARYPAEFQLIAAMNPCPCGRFGDANGSCTCTAAMVAQYRARVSAPLLDRFDIHLEVPRVQLTDFEPDRVPVESSDMAAGRVRRAREIQVSRQGRCNARLPDGQLRTICAPDVAGRAVLERAMKLLGFSARARQRILRLARTIADLNEVQTVTAHHIGEAISYRGLDRRVPLPGASAGDPGAV